MLPLQAAITAAFEHMKTPLLQWLDFAELGRACLRGLLSVLPDDPAEAMRMLRAAAHPENDTETTP
jgi:hypothetical protein